MCGRFSVNINYEELKNRFPNHQIKTFDTIFNFRPTMQLPVFTHNEVINMKWGLIPSWANDSSFASKMINARSETLLEKPSFKNIVHTQRCIIVSNGFYEWDSKTKQPYFIYPRNSQIINFGGLYSSWIDNEKKQIYTFTIITTQSNNIISKIHNRMPMILYKGDEIEWLNPKNKFNSVKKLIKPIDDNLINMHEISKKVNSVKNNSNDIQNKVNKLF